MCFDICVGAVNTGNSIEYVCRKEEALVLTACISIGMWNNRTVYFIV